MLTGHLRGFRHAFATWGWLMQQVTDTHFFCAPPGPDEPSVTDLIPGARGQYIEDDPWIERYTTGAGIPLDPVPPVFSGSVAGPAAACAIHNAFRQLDQTYDVVIRCRPDNLFRSGVNIGLLMKQDPGAIWVPERYSWGGYCDRFGFGSMESMAYYSNFYFHLNDWVGDGSTNWSGNQETRYYYYLRHRNVKRFQIDFCQVQADGQPRNHQPQDWGLFSLPPGHFSHRP